jgi:hypothetical protein
LLTPPHNDVCRYGLIHTRMGIIARRSRKYAGERHSAL